MVGDLENNVESNVEVGEEDRNYVTNGLKENMRLISL